MFYFAKVESDNTISEVIVIAESDCGDLSFPESETIGQQFIASLGKDGDWLQTSLTGEFRRYFASMEGQYVPDVDIFTEPQPFPSWSLNSNYEWEAPTPKPEEDGFWMWNETDQQWER